MTYRATCVAIIALILLAGSSFAADNNLKQLSDSGITVSYPPSMEAQAKKVMEIAKTAIQPSVEVQRQTASLLANSDMMAKDIARLLGADEKTEKIKIRLHAYRDKSRALAQCFSHIRLVSKAGTVATDGIDAGVLQVRYDKTKDEFKMAMELGKVDDDILKRSYFPVIVNSDGSIRSEKKLAEMAQEFLGAGKLMVIAPVHDTVGYTIAEELKLYYPFTRWFNEGVSGWITRYVVLKANPKLSETVSTVVNISDRSKALRDKINLWSWPQGAFRSPSSKGFDPALEIAQSQYSVEALSEMLGKNIETDLPKVMSAVNYNGSADTDTICAAIKKVTGKDAKTIFMSYVPKDIKSGIDSGEVKKLMTEAEKLVQDKNWAQASAKLRTTLDMDPTNVNARLNLAWIEREENERLDSEIQVFLSARLLDAGNYKFSLFAPSIEGNYVMGRLAILLGDVQYAKKFLEPVLQLDPNHKDARRAMDEIKRIEDAAKGAGG